jgi:hypothetical protein
MKKIVKLKESDLTRIVKRVMMEQNVLDVSDIDGPIPPVSPKEDGAERLSQEFQKMMGEPSKKELIKVLKNKLSEMEMDSSYDVDKVCREISEYCSDVRSDQF